MTMEPSSVRASDAERERVIQQLKQALSEGRLDLETFSDRTQTALAAPTRADLASLTADLPHAAPLPHRDTLVLETTSGSRRQTGPWLVPAQIVAACTSGRIHLDFTHAECAHDHVEVRVTCASGTIRITVPRGWRVVEEQVSLRSGTIRNAADAPYQDGSPTLHVYGKAASGTIGIGHPRQPGPLARLLRSARR